jgi:hypothetical protein
MVEVLGEDREEESVRETFRADRGGSRGGLLTRAGGMYTVYLDTRSTRSRCGRSAATMTTIQRATHQAVAAAASRLYDAEVALHLAHSSHVDAWIQAASDRLHEAVVAHLSAVAEASRP